MKEAKEIMGEFFDDQQASRRIQTAPKERFRICPSVVFPAKKAEKFNQERATSTPRMTLWESSFRKERRKNNCGLIGQGIQKPGRLLLEKGNELFLRNSIFAS